MGQSREHAQWLRATAMTSGAVAANNSADLVTGVNNTRGEESVQVQQETELA